MSDMYFYTITLQVSGINQLWLSDLALRLLCVMALDRFGDFVSDEVYLFIASFAIDLFSFTLQHYVKYPSTVVSIHCS